MGDVLKPYIEWEDALKNSLEEFAHSVEKGQQSLSGPMQSMRVMRVLDEAQKMLTNGRYENEHI